MVVDDDRFGERGVHLSCDAAGLLWGCRRQQGGELVPAEPAEQVVGAQDRTQSCCDLDEQGVADAVAVAIVNGLESVEVDHQQGDGRGLRSSEQLSAALLQMTPVGHVGQRVGASLAAGLRQGTKLVKGECSSQQGYKDAGTGELARSQRKGGVMPGHQYRQARKTGQGRWHYRRALDRLRRQAEADTAGGVT